MNANEGNADDSQMLQNSTLKTQSKLVYKCLILVSHEEQREGKLCVSSCVKAVVLVKVKCCPSKKKKRDGRFLVKFLFYL